MAFVPPQALASASPLRVPLQARQALLPPQPSPCAPCLALPCPRPSCASGSAAPPSRGSGSAGGGGGLTPPRPGWSPAPFLSPPLPQHHRRLRHQDVQPSALPGGQSCRQLVHGLRYGRAGSVCVYGGGGDFGECVWGAIAGWRRWGSSSGKTKKAPSTPRVYSAGICDFGGTRTSPRGLGSQTQCVQPHRPFLSCLPHSPPPLVRF